LKIVPEANCVQWCPSRNWAINKAPVRLGPSLKASDYISEYLSSRGVTHVFEVVGGMISHLIDSMGRRGAPKLVSMHHEQAAAFAADAYGRISGIPGVAMATSGPGAINLLTGLGSSYFDSSPTLFITGQVNRNERKGERKIRQLGFQEADIVSIASPICKQARYIDRAEDIGPTLKASFDLALNGRPGPVLLDIPMDVQKEDIAPVSNSHFERQEQLPAEADLERMLNDLKGAKRPLILIGGGVRSAGAADLCRNFISKVGVPAVYSLMGVDVLSSESKLRIGLIGTYANRWANMSIANADLLLVLGSRLDIRQTGADTTFFKGERTIYQMDCDDAEVNNRVKGCLPLIGHLRPLLMAANRLADGISWPNRDSWLKQIAALKDQYPDTAELQDTAGINPNEFMHRLAAHSGRAEAYIADVGQHQMWAAQSLPLSKEQRFITSGGMGAMGFSLPAAIGACLALRNAPVVVIAGDGGFQLNIQELQTVSRMHLPIKIVLLNNQCHGMVRQFQESYFDGRYQSTVFGYSAPQFDKVAQAYGIRSHSITEKSDVQTGIQRLWEDPNAPFLLEVAIDQQANAYPKIAFGRPLDQMEPHAKPLAMEGT
jgi:acetolactate synthase-1/2/3 large subunit